jgi:site-specific recombinase XerD
MLFLLSRSFEATPYRISLSAFFSTQRAHFPEEPVFPTIRGGRLSRDALEHVVRKYAASGSMACPSLAGKRVTPHVLRHSTAMELLQNGVDQSVIALWLGHESVETTQVYVHADLRLKEKALARVAETTTSTPGRYRPDDALLAFLESL